MTDIQRMAAFRLIHDLQDAKDRVENASADNLTIGIVGNENLPFFLGDFLTAEQWEVVKFMIARKINKKIAETQKSLQECTTSGEI